MSTTNYPPPRYPTTPPQYPTAPPQYPAAPPPSSGMATDMVTVTLDRETYLALFGAARLLHSVERQMEGYGLDAAHGTVPGYVTVAELVRRTGLQRETIYAYKARGKLPPPLPAGRALLWPADLIEAWLANRRPRKRRSRRHDDFWIVEEGEAGAAGAVGAS